MLNILNSTIRLENPLHETKPWKECLEGMGVKISDKNLMFGLMLALVQRAANELSFTQVIMDRKQY